MTNFLERVCGWMAVRVLASLIVASGLLLAAHPAGANPLALNYTAYRMSGPSAAPIQEGEFVRSGEKLLIKIRYMNRASGPAPAGVIMLTLPVGCAFVQSRGPKSLAVSVDGGREFGALDRLQVRQNGSARAATGEDVTHIRLTLDHPIAPGEGGEISIVAAQE